MLETSSFCILSRIHLHDAAVVVESDAARDSFCCEFAAPSPILADAIAFGITTFERIAEY